MYNTTSASLNYVQPQDTYNVICVYVYKHIHKILYKARELNLPWYLGKCLKIDAIAPETGINTKLETFYLSVGIWP